jgi:hypothetical protein
LRTSAPICAILADCGEPADAGDVVPVGLRAQAEAARQVVHLGAVGARGQVELQAHLRVRVRAVALDQADVAREPPTWPAMASNICRRRTRQVLQVGVAVLEVQLAASLPRLARAPEP